MRLLMKESYTVDYAGFWLRLGAVLIDGVILWGFNYLMTGIWNISTGLVWSSISTQQIGDAVTVPVTHIGWRWLLFLIVFVAYFMVFWAWRGQTPGKMLARIKITYLDGSNIGWNGAFIRFVGYLISAVFLFIGFFWLPFDARKQGLYDKLANTYVIRLPRKTAQISNPTA
jgi:uncharacterized RDD family membrane protein YckC